MSLSRFWHKPSNKKKSSTGITREYRYISIQVCSRLFNGFSMRYGLSMAFHPEYKGCQFLGQGCHFLGQGCQFLGQGWNIESTQHLPNQSNPIPGQSSHQHAWAPGKLSLELAVTLLPLNCHQNKFRWTDRMDWPDIYWIYDDRASRGLTGWKGANLMQTCDNLEPQGISKQKNDHIMKMQISYKIFHRNSRIY